MKLFRRKFIMLTGILIIMLFISACQNKKELQEEPIAETNIEDEANVEGDASAVFEEFLEGTRPVYIPQEMIGLYSAFEAKGNMAYMTEILQMLNDTYLKFDVEGKIAGIEYAYLDCGKDGQEELAVRFIGVYPMEKESNVVYIIRYDGEQLSVCDTRESWARDGEDIYYYGFIESYGSAGAGDHYAGESVINASGQSDVIYDVEILSGWWTGYVNPEGYEQIFGTDQDVLMEISIYTIEGSEYHTYVSDPNYETECQEYIELCKRQGMEFYPIEEVQQIIEDRKTTLGVTSEVMEKKALDWQVLDSVVYSEYVAE